MISNCIYNFNLIISPARLIKKFCSNRVAGANAELYSPHRRRRRRHSLAVSPERSQHIFGSTLLLSTLCGPASVPVAVSVSIPLPLWSGQAGRLRRLLNGSTALQFICKAYPKMLMGLLYVAVECWTAGGIPIYLCECVRVCRSLSF